MSASADLICIPPGIATGAAWPRVAPLIAQAMKRGDMGSFEDVQSWILSGEALLWLACQGDRIAAAAVTQIATRNDRKVCTLVALGGADRAAWLPLRAGLEEYAKAEGCAAMRVCGRKGWARVLPEYRVTRIVLEKDL